ncbi:VWA domain-containing protein [Gracilibacillus oryzae]|uniref:VWA domain-containing protein n=1 Tax=Gracilibacillus oryzae TaxID=1672701 RepID=A0A7C8KUL6_9BACI|nr:VWA domain-containing protein [Gracilibacillus oryzae]KAB8138993.1 VWA domain-containing protein [Gracilibacillus oryzae]
MKLNHKIILLLTSITFLILSTACSSNDVHEVFAKEKELVEEMPKDLVGILEYPKGSLAELSYDENKESMLETVKSILPPIDEEKEKAYLEDWWNVYYSLVKENYPDPRNIYVEQQLEPFTHPLLQEKETIPLKEQVNVLIVMDVSGSMKKKINGKRLIDIARDSIIQFTEELQDDAYVGLRVYGHEGDSSKDKEKKSCESSELVYELQPLDEEEFYDEIERYEPAGWTPLALSIQQAREDLAEFPSEHNSNIIYVVSDGLDTCGGNPAAVAESLQDTNIKPIINVIGLNVDQAGQSELQKIAKAGRGEYTAAGNEEELQRAFKRAEQMISEWRDWQQLAGNRAAEHKIEQLEEADAFLEKWKEVNQREGSSVFSIINDLRSSGYITDAAHRYFAIKRTERSHLFNEIGENSYIELKEAINGNFKAQFDLINKDIENN